MLVEWASKKSIKMTMVDINSPMLPACLLLLILVVDKMRSRCSFGY